MSEKEQFTHVNEIQPRPVELVIVPSQEVVQDSNTGYIAVFVSEARATRADMQMESATSLAERFAAARQARHDRWAGVPTSQPTLSETRTVEDKLTALFDPEHESVQKTVDAFASARKARHERWSK